LSYSLLSKNVKIKIYKIIILPVVLYGCETWSLTLRKERRPVAYPGILFGGVQQIQLRTEDREDGDLGAVAP